jgi:hypothetical protein
LTCPSAQHEQLAAVSSAHPLPELQQSWEPPPSCHTASTDVRTGATTDATGVDLFIHIDRHEQDRRMT